MARPAQARNGKAGLRKNQNPSLKPQTQGQGAFKRTRHQGFASSRLQNSENDDQPPEIVENEDELTNLGISSGDSDEDGSILDFVVAKPHKALLQSLTSEGHRGEPARKKIRVQENADSKHESRVDEDHVHLNTDLKEYDVDFADKSEDDEPDAAISDSDATENDATENDQRQRCDPYEKQFSAILEQELGQSIKSIQSSVWFTRRIKLTDSWKTLKMVPPRQPDAECDRESLSNTDWMQDIKLKSRLQSRARILFPRTDGMMGCLGQDIFNYRDVMLCDGSFAVANDLRSMVCLHALNHVLKTRDKIIKNSVKLTKLNNPEDLEFRDQGFTRPKVLFLLPTRQSCVRAVNTILNFYEPEQQENKKRFQESYDRSQDDISDDKPEDFRNLFAGNDDDMFRLGLKFTRKAVKLFSQFYGSDIIFASPLGLHMAIGTEESKKQDYDYLSSIELVFIDQADAMLMQNWEHVEYIFDRLNKQPKEAHGCDFSRVRNWYLNGNAQYLRQTIVFTPFLTPEVNKLFSRHMLNIAGKTKISKDQYQGAISEMSIQLRQTFSRFESAQPAEDPDARFHHFANTIIPPLARSSKVGSARGQGILLFIPSYMDFVRLRNFLAASNVAQNISFAAISEYTPARNVAQARSHFSSGKHSVLLYTGRAHHFRRYRIRGVKQVVMYALPDNPIFYKEIAGEFLTRSIIEGIVDHEEATVRTLFSKWDVLKLERVVGTKRLAAMLKDNGGDVFEFL